MAKTIEKNGMKRRINTTTTINVFITGQYKTQKNKSKKKLKKMKLTVFINTQKWNDEQKSGRPYKKRQSVTEEWKQVKSD